MKIKVKRFDKKIPLPKYEKLAAGFDFVCRKGATIKPKEIKAVPSNVACEIPDGYVLLVVPRSSTAKRFGLLMPHSIGISDPFYCGDDNEIILLFYNFTDHSAKIKKGDKIAQGILIKFEKAEFEEVNKLNKSSRKKWNVKIKKYAKKINKIYISGRLTHARKKQRVIYEKIAEICKSTNADIYVPHLSGTDPIKHPDVLPYDVWVKDHREVAACDLIIAYVGQPSLGVGAELEIARITTSDIILWWFKGEKVSRMAKGNPAVIKQIEAENEEDLYNQLKIFLKK